MALYAPHFVQTFFIIIIFFFFQENKAWHLLHESCLLLLPDSPCIGIDKPEQSV